jgi:hypothetical protein
MEMHLMPKSRNTSSKVCRMRTRSSSSTHGGGGPCTSGTSTCRATTTPSVTSLPAVFPTVPQVNTAKTGFQATTPLPEPACKQSGTSWISGGPHTLQESQCSCGHFSGSHGSQSSDGDSHGSHMFSTGLPSGDTQQPQSSL